MRAYLRGHEGVEAAPTGINHQGEAEDGAGHETQLDEAGRDRRLIVHHDVPAHLFVVECQVTKVTHLQDSIAPLISHISKLKYGLRDIEKYINNNFFDLRT